MENLMKRMDFRLVTTSSACEKAVSKPTFRKLKVFNPSLVGLHMSRPKVTLNKPIYAGFAVLELSKLLMYKFHYCHIWPTYGNNVDLCYQDTDSYIYYLQCSDVYRDMESSLDKFDTSNYPESHFLFSEANKRKIGKMKDELGGVPIAEFVALKPKMYSVKSAEGADLVKAKGVGQAAMKHVSHEEYVLALLNQKRLQHTFHSLRSVKHKVYTMKCHKYGLFPYDDKRYILPDGIHTLSIGNIHAKRKAVEQLFPSSPKRLKTKFPKVD